MVWYIDCTHERALDSSNRRNEEEEKTKEKCEKETKADEKGTIEVCGTTYICVCT